VFKEVAITPIPKPRMTRGDAWNKRPCVVRYWEFKDRLNALWGCDKKDKVPDTFHVIFILPMPKGWSEKKKLEYDNQPHQIRPDTSNLLKAFEDCLLEEDSQLWDIRATKIWGREGKIILKNL
jgi:Holliday junction resolvase RusA-like endonuclease